MTVESYPSTWYGVFSLVIWMLVCLPFILAGGIAGWLCGAFLYGFRRGRSDYKRYLEPI